MGAKEIALTQQVKNEVLTAKKYLDVIEPCIIETGFTIPTAGGYTHLDSAKMLAPAKDGSYIHITDTAQAYSLYNSAGTLTWSVTFTDINASCTRWFYGFHWDTVDNKIYVVANDATLNDLYFASINPATGAVTNIATIVGVGADASTDEAVCGLSRSANGSGNFTISNNAFRLVLNADGTVIVSEVLTASTSRYTSSDGIRVLSLNCVAKSDSHIDIYIHVNDTLSQISVSKDIFGFGLSYGSFGPVGIGSYIALHAHQVGTGIVSGVRYLNRVDFDRVIKEAYELNLGVTL